MHLPKNSSILAIGPTKKLYKLNPTSFKRVFDKFKKNGVASANASSSNPKHPMHEKGAQRSDLQIIQSIQEFFVENPMASLLDASFALKIPK